MDTPARCALGDGALVCHDPAQTFGAALERREAVIANDMRKVGTALNSAVTNYNAFASSLETRALVTGRKFRDLNIETGDREIEAVPPVETLARGLMAPELDGPQAEAAE